MVIAVPFLVSLQSLLQASQGGANGNCLSLSPRRRGRRRLHVHEVWSRRRMSTAWERPGNRCSCRAGTPEISSRPNRLARIQVGSDAAEDGKRRRGLSFAATKYSELSGKGTGAGAGTATGAGPGMGPGPGTGAGARQQQQQQQQQQASADDRDYSLLISSPSTSVRPNRLSISDIDGDSRSSW